jgi:hypothetical protein
MTPTILSQTEFRTLMTQQGLTCSEDEIADFHEAYGLVRAMAARIRKPRSHMVEPAAVFAPLAPATQQR